MGAINLALVMSSWNWLSRTLKHTTDTAAPESKRKVTGVEPMHPLICKMLLMLYNLKSCLWGWCFTDDGASWHPPAELAHSSFKGSFDISDHVHHNCSRDGVANLYDVFFDLVDWHNIP